jgi:hypothetical protein
MEKLKSKSEHVLMNAIGFTEEDLEANQQGLTSKKQRLWLKNHKSWWLGIMTFLALVACPLVSLTVLYTFQSSDSSDVRLLIIGFVSVLVVGSVSHAEIKQRRFNNVCVMVRLMSPKAG